MRKMKQMRQQGFGLLGLLSLLLVAVSLMFNVSPAPVYAQAPTPTATPSDPVWRAFSTVREALEEEFSIDLTIVSSYTWEQTEWEFSIDDCDAEIDPADHRPFYIGWTFRVTSLQGTTYQARVSFDLRAVAICDEVTQSFTVDDEEGEDAIDPNLPQPVAGSGATGDFELGGHVLGLGLDTVSYMNQAGMTWVKKQLRYNLGDGTDGAQNFISDAQSKGFKILLGIVGYPDQMGDYENYVQQYAEFLGQVAALGPDAIEIWNEPNIASEWPEGQIDGARYTQMLAAGFNAIKTANPNVIVISAAPAPTGAEAAFPGRVVNDDRFMQQMANAGAGNFLDCIGLHYNEGAVAPSASSGDPTRNFYPTLYFGSMLQRGTLVASGKPICWTELGYLSPDGFETPLPGNFSWGSETSVAEQAAWLAEAVSLSAQSASPRVRLMIVWNVNFNIYGADPQAGFAMIRPDGSCPACATVGAVMGQ